MMVHTAALQEKAEMNGNLAVPQERVEKRGHSAVLAEKAEKRDHSAVLAEKAEKRDLSAVLAERHSGPQVRKELLNQEAASLNPSQMMEWCVSINLFPIQVYARVAKPMSTLLPDW
jgi:hypothetical protein